MKVGDVICVADFHDLCPRQVHDFVGNLSRTLSQSRRNGIWAILYFSMATRYNASVFHDIQSNNDTCSNDAQFTSCVLQQYSASLSYALQLQLAVTMLQLSHSSNHLPGRASPPGKKARNSLPADLQ